MTSRVANDCGPVTVPTPVRDTSLRRGLSSLLFTNSAWLLTSLRIYMCKGCETTPGLLPLSEKTRTQQPPARQTGACPNVREAVDLRDKNSAKPKWDK